MEGLFYYMFGLVCIYTIIPTVFIRLFGHGASHKKTAAQSIALTFDDGPDPTYTPQLLDLLKRYEIKATFFVVGIYAERHPELIKRMHREGHLIGVHNYIHHPNAFMTPGKVRRQLDHAVDVVERIIGVKPSYYRPPWGVINLFDFWLLKRFRIIFWSIIVGDWRSSGGKNKIKLRLLRKLRGGSVIVLHDSGQTLGADLDAPVYMLEALDEFIAETAAKGFSFVTVDEMYPNRLRNSTPSAKKKSILVSAWLVWERLFHALFAVKPLDAQNPLFYIRVCRYHGLTIRLPDEEKIESGDRVVELHLNNRMLFQLASNSRSMVQLAVQLIGLTRQLLPKIAETIVQHSDGDSIKGVYGITMIHRGTEQLGFTLADLPRGWFSVITRIYLKLLLYVIHPDGKNRLRGKKNALIPKVVAISSKQLLTQYPYARPSATGHNAADSPNLYL